ncbi:lipoate--protein ligase family protein [Haloferula sp.]|uniref:lipoate--protein ligase family protein n=1 Tax=Haloferula sp. TaxID=2497595 RepID=UPI00329BFFC3
MIERLKLWMDDVVRDGPVNMAVDEWLLNTATEPVLRVYRWEENWGSYGYFVPDEEAAAALVGLKRVRRWTGGGIVDHRSDWTYSLVLPRGESLAESRGAESYRVIHLALAEALRGAGLACEVSEATEIPPGGECFKKAVEHDLMDGHGKKIAGAGQRRTTQGLLHQGSLAIGGDEALAQRLADALASRVIATMISPDDRALSDILVERYSTEQWRARR